MIHIGSLPASWPSVVAVDLETQGLDPHQHAILSVTIFDGTDTWVVFPAHPCYQEIGKMLADETVEKVFHNSKFDIKFLQKNGFTVVSIFDTMLAEAVIGGGNGAPLSLDEVLARQVGVFLSKDTRKNFEDHEPYSPIEYSGSPDRLNVGTSYNTEIRYMMYDVLHLLKLRDVQQLILKRNGLLRAYQLEIGVVQPLVDLELAGLCLDVPLWLSYIEEFDKRIVACTEEMLALLGEDFVLEVPATRKGQPIVKQLTRDEINLNSPAQLKHLLMVLGAEKVESTAEAALEALLEAYASDLPTFEITSAFGAEATCITAPEIGTVDYFVDGHNYLQLDPGTVVVVRDIFVSDEPEFCDSVVFTRDNLRYHVGVSSGVLRNEKNINKTKLCRFIELVLELRMWVKRRGYDYEKYINPVTGRIHPDYHQIEARTARLSCRKPNFQQVPRPTPNELNMRILWGPDSEEFAIISADFAQQEVRLFAAMSQDSDFIAACEGEDVYAAFGKTVYGYLPDKKSPERMIMKQFVLAVGYMAGVERLHAASGLPREECDRIRSLIRSSFPVAAAYGQEMVRQARVYGFVTTATGRRRYFNTNDEIGTQAVNTPIQGTGADILKLSVRKIYSFLTEARSCAMIHPNTRIWGLVHDEVLIHVHKSELCMILPAIKQLMEEAASEICPSVKHVVEIGWHDRWDK